MTTKPVFERAVLTAKEASERYGIPAGSLANKRYLKEGPRYFKRDRKIFYKIADFESWLYQYPVQTIDSFNDK